MKRAFLTSVTVVLAVGLSMFVRPYQTAGETPTSPSASKPSSKKAADAAEIARLIHQLGSDDFTEREAASNALDALGETALPALRKAQDNSDLEIRRRAAHLVKVLTERRAPMRAKAWAAVVKLNGRIDFGMGTPDGQIGGIDFCSSRKLRDEDLALLQWLDEAEGLGLINTWITDGGLVHVKKLYRLRVLDLQGVKVTDAGLKQLKGLDRLSSLVLCATRVTDAGLIHLKALKSLHHLDLAWTRVTDRGIEHIKEMRALTWLDLSHTQVTDAGLAKLKTLDNLSYLDLSNTPVTDVGLAHLKEIRTLKTLSLDGTKITERGKAEWFKEEIRRAKASRRTQGGEPR